MYGIEKIKTLGDCYMACGGLPEKLADNADKMILLGQDMINTLKEISQTRKVDLQVRVGIHNGRVSSGVIGTKKFIYGEFSLGSRAPTSI